MRELYIEGGPERDRAGITLRGNAAHTELLCADGVRLGNDPRGDAACHPGVADTLASSTRSVRASSALRRCKGSTGTDNDAVARALASMPAGVRAMSLTRRSVGDARLSA